MSYHLDPRNTLELRDALRKHGLATDTPSQNADCFRVGFWYARAALSPLPSATEGWRPATLAHEIADRIEAAGEPRPNGDILADILAQVLPPPPVSAEEGE